MSTESGPHFQLMLTLGFKRLVTAREKRSELCNVGIPLWGISKESGKGGKHDSYFSACFRSSMLRILSEVAGDVITNRLRSGNFTAKDVLTGSPSKQIDSFAFS